MNNKSILVLLLLVSAVWATSINNAHFDASDSTWHFYTDMQITADFNLELVSGEVASGVDENNIQTGDAVCSGSVLRVTPDLDSEWATPDLDIVSIYPTCGGGYCPAMISYGTVNTNRDITWLTSSVFNNHQTFGNANDFSQDQSRYTQLGTFHTQTVTYNQNLGVFDSGKRGGANIFCKGDFQVRDGGTIAGSTSLPSTAPVDFTVSTVGSHAITGRIDNADCFGALVKHPINDVDHPAWFFMYYFTHKSTSTSNSLSSGSLGLDTVTITVQDSGGICLMNEIDVDASSSLSDEDFIMLRTTMHNSGDPIQVTSVTGSSSHFDVDPFPVALCDILGFPPSICPSSNGFGETINSGGNKDLYVLIERLPGATGGTILTFNAETISASCGGTASCTDTLNLGNNVPVFCEIEPTELTYGTLEVAEFLVACENLAGDPISCVGNNWYWDSISGGFVEATNTHALAYPESPPGSSGTLNYESGIAHCLSDVDVITPYYECEFIPPSAEMDTGDSEYFELNCFAGGSSSTPDDADYAPIDGLLGSTSNSSTDGTTFDAGADSDGDLQGYAFWNDPVDDPVLGAIALAPIIIGNGSGNDSNETGDNDPDGSSEWCTIGTGPLEVYPGFSGWVPIGCGPSGDQPCENVTWYATGYVSLSGGTDSGTSYTATGDPGDGATINAYLNGDTSKSCYRGFTIQEPYCWEFS